MTVAALLAWHKYKKRHKALICPVLLYAHNYLRGRTFRSWCLAHILIVARMHLSALFFCMPRDVCETHLFVLFFLQIFPMAAQAWHLTASDLFAWHNRTRAGQPPTSPTRILLESFSKVKLQIAAHTCQNESVISVSQMNTHTHGDTGTQTLTHARRYTSRIQSKARTHKHCVIRRNIYTHADTHALTVRALKEMCARTH